MELLRPEEADGGEEGEDGDDAAAGPAAIAAPSAPAKPSPVPRRQPGRFKLSWLFGGFELSACRKEGMERTERQTIGGQGRPRGGGAN